MLARAAAPQASPGPRWRRKRWNSRARTSPEGRSPGSGSGSSSGRGLLEALDEGLHVGVALRPRGHLALVVAGGRLELAGVDGHADERLELAHERERGLRVRRGGDVVRHARPQRRRRDAAPLARVVQDADDAGRALVARGCTPRRSVSASSDGRPGDRDRPRVRDVGQQRAERHDHLHAERLGEVDDELAERAPAHATARCPASRMRSRGARGTRAA